MNLNEKIDDEEMKLYNEIEEFNNYITKTNLNNINQTKNQLILAHQKLLNQQNTIMNNNIDIDSIILNKIRIN